MAQNTDRPKAITESEEAMNTVLRAEQQAREAVAACEAQAERLLEEARRQALSVSERADQRISRLHNHCAGVLQQRMAQLLQQGGIRAGGAQAESQAREVLAAAIAKLAERLTTSSSEEGASE